MTELVCNFAVIRLRPYRETGEFVNVGVVLHAPETGFFGHRLKTGRKNRWVRAFFPDFDMAVYAAAVRSLDGELNRRRELFEKLKTTAGDRLATVWRPTV